MGARRGNAEGSIYKRGDGRWAAAISLGGGRRRAFYGRTRGAVQEKLKAARRTIDDGLPLSSDRQTFAKFANRWLDDVARVTVKAKTFLFYESILRLHIMPAIGTRPLSRVAPQDLQALYTRKLEQGLSPQTVGHIHRVTHRVLQDAVRWGLVARNVCDAVKPPRAPRREMSALTPEEARKLLASAAGDPLEALYALALTTGMRQGEILSLKWSDFDADTGRLTVQRTVLYISGQGSIEGEPKSDRGRRNILLTPLAVAALRAHRALQAEERIRAVAWEDNDLIFCNAVGRHIRASNLLRRSFRPLLARAGLPAIRFHDLRHTAATLLLLQGVHVKVVSEMLGHSSVSLTLDVYSHVLPSMQSDAAAKMEALFLTKRTAV